MLQWEGIFKSVATTAALSLTASTRGETFVIEQDTLSSSKKNDLPELHSQRNCLNYILQHLWLKSDVQSFNYFGLLTCCFHLLMLVLLSHLCQWEEHADTDTSRTAGWVGSYLLEYTDTLVYRRWVFGQAEVKTTQQPNTDKQIQSPHTAIHKSGQVKKTKT